MKIMHLSDLHIGKRVNGFSMAEDQQYILNQIITSANQEKPDAVVIAGDVYDKTVPSAEAVQIFDDFLTNLTTLLCPVFIISGNHDSAERLTFASRLLENEQVYISGDVSEQMEPVLLEDEYGPVAFYRIPYVKPSDVRRLFAIDQNDAEYSSEQAIRELLAHMDIDETKRNVLVLHQFVTGAATCESEELWAGGMEQIAWENFWQFDYVALGHLHGPQSVGRETVRYCGTPLKYSFSEVTHQKSITFVELKNVGEPPCIRTVPLIPRREMLEETGTYEEVTSRSFYEKLDTEAYFHITLMDEEDVPDALAKLRSIYPHIMKLDYDNQRTRENAAITVQEQELGKSPLELFLEFYELQNNQKMTEAQKKFAKNLIKTIWEDET